MTLTRHLGSNGINVCLVVGSTTVGNGVLSGRRFGSTVTVGQVVDDGLDELVSALSSSSSEVFAQNGDFGG